MKLLSSLTTPVLGFVSLCFLASCQDEDFGYTTQQVRDSVYGRNFEKTFGKLSEIPTFDLSSYNLNRLGLEGGPSNASLTRAGGSINVLSPYFDVPSSLSGWMDSNLPEGNNNTSKGTRDFQFMMPNNDVLIIPLYQGQAGMIWNLMLSDNGTTSNSIKLWEKSDLLEVKNINFTETIVKSQTFEIPPGHFKGDDGQNQVLELNSYLTQLGFDKNNNWFKVELSGLSSDGNGTLGIAGGENMGKVDFNNGNATFSVKDSKILSSDNIEFVQWWPKKNNNKFNLKITTYQITTDANWTQVKSINTGENNKNTIEKLTRSKAIRISPENVAPGSVFSLYLDIKNLDAVCWNDGSDQHYRDHYSNRTDMWSTNGQMLALTSIQNDGTIGSDLQSNLSAAFGSDRTYDNLMILGCEDSNKQKSEDKKHDGSSCGDHGSDWDINDVVFLVVGMSEKNIVKKDDKVINKRYMIEDLGSTFDFDFNDMVVDVTQVQHYENDVLKNSETYASLVHLCGTIPFKIQIGETVFGPYPGKNNNAPQGGDGYDPSNDNTYSDFKEAEVQGWNPETNNIIVTTWPKNAGMTEADFTDSGKNDYLGILGEGNSFRFPVSGEYPYIIACDQSVNWMKELITIPNSWFVVNPKNTNPGPQYGNGDGPAQENENNKVSTDPVIISKGQTSAPSDNQCNKVEIETSELQVGKTIKIYFEGDWLNVFHSHWGNSISYSEAYSPSKHKFKVLTQEDISAIKSNGLYVQGSNATVSKVTIE